MEFEETNNYIYFGRLSYNKDKLLILDLDGTLINTKTSRLAYRIVDSHDWIFLGDIPEQLEQLSQEYDLIIITNQTHFSEIRRDKLSQIYEALKIPLIGLKNKSWAKPNLEVFKLIDRTKYCQIDFCGDAIGDHTNPSYNWSTSDYKFYANFKGNNFYSPDQLFPYSKLPSKYSNKEAVIIVGPDGPVKDELVAHFTNMKYGSKGNKLIFSNSTGYPDKASRREIIENLNHDVRIIWIIRDQRAFEYWSEKQYIKYIYHFEEPTEDEGVIRLFW